MENWFYAQAELKKPAEIDILYAGMQLAHDEGFTGMVFHAPELSHPQIEGAAFRRLCRDIRARCTALGLKLFVSVAPACAARGLLWANPECAASQRCEGYYVVKNGDLVPVKSEQVVLPSIEDEGYWWFEEPCNGPRSYDSAAAIKLTDFDKAPKGCARFSPRGGVAVLPNRHLIASVEVKLEDFPASHIGNVQISIRGHCRVGKRDLVLNLPRLDPDNADWQWLAVSFNTLDCERIDLTCGIWEVPTQGTVWMREPQIEPAGFWHTIPDSVRAVDRAGAEVDLLDGGGWGFLGDWGKQPVPCSARTTDYLTEGDRLFIRHRHAVQVAGGQIQLDLESERGQELVKQQIEWVAKVLQPDGYVLQCATEIRAGDYDEPSETLAQFTKFCLDTIIYSDPGKPVIAWPDDLDPHHNGGDGWQGLIPQFAPFAEARLDGEGGIIPLNWSPREPESTIRWAQLGCRQVKSLNTGGKWQEQCAEWIKAVKDKDIPGIIAVLATNWDKGAARYSTLPAFAAVTKEGA